MRQEHQARLEQLQSELNEANHQLSELACQQQQPAAPDQLDSEVCHEVPLPANVQTQTIQAESAHLAMQTEAEEEAKPDVSTRTTQTEEEAGPDLRTTDTQTQQEVNEIET